VISRLESLRGIGDIVAGMARQEYELELRRYNGRSWRAQCVSSTRSLRMLVARGRRVRGRRYSARRLTRLRTGSEERLRHAIGLRLTTHHDDADEL